MHMPVTLLTTRLPLHSTQTKPPDVLSGTHAPCLHPGGQVPQPCCRSLRVLLLLLLLETCCRLSSATAPLLLLCCTAAAGAAVLCPDRPPTGSLLCCQSRVTGCWPHSWTPRELLQESLLGVDRGSGSNPPLKPPSPQPPP